MLFVLLCKEDVSCHGIKLLKLVYQCWKVRARRQGCRERCVVLVSV